MTRVRELTLSHGVTTERTSGVSSLGIQPIQSQPADSLLVEPHPAFGDMTCTIPAESEIRAQAPNDGDELPLQVASDGKNPAEFDLQSDELAIKEANRVKLTGLRLRNDLNESYFSLAASNRRGLVHLLLIPDSSSDNAQAKATAFFQPSNVELSLIHQKLAIIRNGVIKLGGCKSPRIKIDGKDSLGLAKDISSEFSITCRSFSIEALTVRTESTTGRHGVIAIEGRGSVESIRQDDRELVPTALQEILNKSPSEKGLYALFAAFFILAGTTLVNRCLSILAVIIFPEQEHT